MVERRQVVQTRTGLDVLLTEPLLGDPQRPLEERLRLVVSPLGQSYAAQVVQAASSRL